MSTQQASVRRSTPSESQIRQRRVKLLMLVSISLVSLVAAAGLLSFNPISSVIAWGTKTKPQASGPGVTVGRSGEPFIKLQGNDLTASFTGPSEAEIALNGNQADPVSAVAVRGNLVVGYTSPKGQWLALLPGNEDSIFPNSAEAQRRRAQGSFVDAPFQRAASAFTSPARPDFLKAGDFDNDGFTDLVVAELKVDQLFLLPGNDKGGFDSGVWSSIPLPGGVTALEAGTVNRADGLTSVVVATTGLGGNQLLVFQSPLGALKAAPEVFPLAGEATSVALTQLHLRDSWADIVVSYGSSISVIHGRDRKLYLDDRTPRNVPPASIEQRSFPFAVASIRAGDFTSDNRIDIAMLAKDGSVHLLNQSGDADAALQAWTEKRLGGGAWPGAKDLVAARVSSLPRESLVIRDPVTNSIEILGDGSVVPNPDGSRPAVNWPELVSATLNVSGGAGAIVPLRMNSHARAGLVVLRNGHSAPSVVLPTVAMTFTVTNTNDAGPGSLRQAINDSNNNPGADTITFAIGSGPQTIAPVSEMSPVLDAVTIDGTSQPGFGGTPIITLNGGSTPSGIGLKVAAGTTTVRGMVINNCFLNAVQFIQNGANLLEGCYIG
ncbi:MAG TPA: VCBS repeat-containing protein, partial [Blastocatellia bacterium]|nr:VCBS repeat-containing protein [Blastocatellia bacterium]